MFCNCILFCRAFAQGTMQLKCLSLLLVHSSKSSFWDLKTSRKSFANTYPFLQVNLKWNYTKKYSHNSNITFVVNTATYGMVYIGNIVSSCSYTVCNTHMNNDVHHSAMTLRTLTIKANNIVYNTSLQCKVLWNLWSRHSCGCHLTQIMCPQHPWRPSTPYMAPARPIDSGSSNRTVHAGTPKKKKKTLKSCQRTWQSA